MKAFQLLLIWLLGMPHVAVAALVCAKVHSSQPASFQAAVDFYNERIHGPDANHPVAKVRWEKTLHKPLRANMAQIVKNVSRGKKISMAYIGVGNAPLFRIGDPNTLRILNQLKKLYIFDVSKSQLAEGLANIRKVADSYGIEIQIEASLLDVTAGFANEYLKSLVSIVDSSSSMAEVSQQMNGNSVLERMREPSLSNLGLPSGIDLIYSEMVATFPGIPANIQFENKLREKFAGRRDFDQLWPGIEKRLHSFFQKFNDLSLQVQARVMSAMGQSGSHLAIATDTTKIYDNPGLPSLFSFTTTHMPAILDLIPKWIGEGIKWDDSTHDQSQAAVQEGNHALQPHKHLVVEQVYQIP